MKNYYGEVRPQEITECITSKIYTLLDQFPKRECSNHTLTLPLEGQSSYEPMMAKANSKFTAKRQHNTKHGICENQVIKRCAFYKII